MNLQHGCHPCESVIELLFQYKNILAQGVFKSFHKNKTDEYETINKFIRFLQKDSNCFNRNNKFGHFTASSIVLNCERTHVLLTHHKKLKKWLQLGGHADGDSFLQRVAFREAVEESSIENLKIINASFDKINKSNNLIVKELLTTNILPIDIDIHVIPETEKEPEHFHYDVRFLFIAMTNQYVISHESIDLKWVDLAHVSNYTQEESTLRQINKVNFILKNFPEIDF